MKRPMLGIAIVVLVGATSCGTEISEVRTNSGRTLDCPSNTVLYAAINPAPNTISPTVAEVAMNLLGTDLLPERALEVESESTDRVVFVVKDDQGHRLGRIILWQEDGIGWVPMQTERCG